VYRFSDSTEVVRAGGTWTWRNNNPGNLRRSTDAIGTSGGFAVFSDVQVGFEAHVRLMRSPLYQSKTILQAMSAYAPPEDNNDPIRYANFVASRAGVLASTGVGTLTEAQFWALIDAIHAFEGWRMGTETIRGNPWP